MAPVTEIQGLAQLDNRLKQRIMAVSDELHQAALLFFLVFTLIFFLLAMLDLCLTRSPANPSMSARINPASPRKKNAVINHLCHSQRHPSPPFSLSFSRFQLVDEEKSVVMTEMEKLVAFCQQLQMGAKTPVQGKTATFQKVPILHLSRICLYLHCLFNALSFKLVISQSAQIRHTGVIIFV